MKKVITKLVQADRNKDVSKEKIIKAFNKGADARKYEILIELINSKAKPIGTIGLKTLKLIDVKTENSVYKFKYSGENCNNKEMLMQLIDIDYSEYYEAKDKL